MAVILRSKWLLGVGAFFSFVGGARAASPLPVNVPAGTGQQALSIFVAQGDIVAASCAAAPCTSGAVSLGVPAELRGRPAHAEVVALGGARRAVVLSVGDGTREFRAVLAGPLAPGAPKVVFAGMVGHVSGQDGSRNGPMVQVSDAEPDGTHRILVGEQREDVSLCGRPTILAPRLLVAQDLELKAAKVQRLGIAERDRARTVKATRMGEDEPRGASVLTALAASSGLGAPQALTDGDPETSWSENVGGAGKGEFVVMRAPPELPISGLELTIRPKTSVIENGASPETLFVAGPKEVVQVELPEDAWKNPGARYRVVLDPPLQSSCLALVLDGAFDSSAKAAVSVTEVAVVSELSASDVQAMVAALAGGGQRAEAAKALLVAGGSPAFAEVAKQFDDLDEGGRRVALQVMDAAPCEISAPVYVTALTGKIEAQARHVESRLRRCGAAAGPALEAALAKSDRTDKRLFPLLTGELSLVDPARSVKAFLPLMNEKTVQRRRLLRTVLAQAARQPQADSAIRASLVDPSTSEVALVDLLRALGDSVTRFQPEAGQALVRLQGAQALRTRYLLLGPTAVLSRTDSGADRAFRRSLGEDPDPHVRAAALAMVTEPKRYRAELLKGLADADVRVREAAVRALSTGDGAFASRALLERLQEDRWPLVRAAVADTLVAHPAGAALDQPLTEALSDDSPLVRARAIRALGERNVRRAAEHIRERLIDDAEWPEVRAEAARSLGTLCDSDSVDVLAAFAKKLGDPMASAEAQLIATGSVLSLGRLAPTNLNELLAPLTDKKAPPQARRAAASARSARTTCRNRH